MQLSLTQPDEQTVKQKQVSAPLFHVAGFLPMGVTDPKCTCYELRETEVRHLSSIPSLQ